MAPPPPYFRMNQNVPATVISLLTDMWPPHVIPILLLPPHATSAGPPMGSCSHHCTPVRRCAPPAHPPPHSSSSPAAAPTLLAAMRAPPGAAVCPFHRRAGGCGRARRGVRRHEGRWRLWDVLLLAWRRRREPAELTAGARNRQARGARGGEQGGCSSTRRRAGGPAAREQEERGGGPVCEQEEPMVGGTDEEGPVCDQEELHLHFRRGRHLLLGR